ncbi:glycosyltransferase family 39 protein [Pontibacter silvestris]|uniref:Glycosyltransferase family 39 protein n=1 Tax=Pontibacter silvestris TaxID=2305183 RepID=A0ABW4WUH1_9BACT|nr:glycosyltransferase family 39 protein [Pontibacter silvestris]MCC9138122.1 glycosyltransferase family 39 protein [Pontibacter silvestris]
MNFWELATLPLEYEQKAPIGYLWIVRLFVIFFGKGEMALRLFSLISGIASLFIFMPIARYFLKPWAAVMALGILALSTPAVYHSVEAKQYSSELFASILALLFYTRYSRQISLGPLVKWGILGGGLLLFSYSVIFVLAGIAFAICLNTLLNRNWRKLLLYLIPFSIWLLCFALTYIFFIGKYKDSGWLAFFFEKHHGFMPVPPTSVSEFLWFPRVPYLALQYPLGLLLNFSDVWYYNYSKGETLLRMPLLPILLEIAGLIYLFRKDKLSLAVFIFPIILALTASGLKLYPFLERFTLFTTPLLILIIALGAEQVYTFFAFNAKMAAVLFVLILAPPLWNSARTVANPNLFYKREFNREALLFVNDRFKEGDTVYLYWNTVHIYEYYKEAYHLKFDAIEGKDLKNVSNCKEEYLANLRPGFNGFEGNKRLWLVYDKNVRNNIGDFVGYPKWYHDPKFIPGKMLEDTFSTYGKKTEFSINDKKIAITLFDLYTKSNRTEDL